MSVCIQAWLNTLNSASIVKNTEIDSGLALAYCLKDCSLFLHLTQ